MIRRIMLLVTVAAVMAATLAVGAATAAEKCDFEGSVSTCIGGFGSGGSLDADQDGTPDTGYGGGYGGMVVYDTTNDNALTSSRGSGFGSSDPEIFGPNGGAGQRCTGTLNEPECVGGSSRGR